MKSSPGSGLLSMAVATLRSLGFANSMRLASWKARTTARAISDRRGGAARLIRLADEYEAAWKSEWAAGGISGWLHRPGAGVFWFDDDPVDWARRTCAPADLELADRSVAGVFDLIGSGPVQLGVPPAWRTDLYNGLTWPLDESSRYGIIRGNGSDIRTVWELSRCYHFIALARSHVATDEALYRLTFADHVQSFIVDNPIGSGPHWTSPMDVAIRCANWCAVIPIFAGSDLPIHFWAKLLAHLHASGLFLERHLEWHPVYRGNHYVADLVGLLYLGVLFRGTPAGNRWLTRATLELQNELAYQVGSDGVCREASIGYHRLVTELFAWAGELLKRNCQGFKEAKYDAAMTGMYRFIGTYLQPDGRAPILGDADDGRLHLMDPVVLREPRLHGCGLPPNVTLPRPADGVHAFEEGGFYIIRSDNDHATIRCGAVGLRGAGSHDHNDQLSLELVIAGRRIVTDSGTYAYTRDLIERHAFRATAAHNVVQLGDDEQNPISADKPWRVLADRTRSECVDIEETAHLLAFTGRHYGFSNRPSRAVCTRRIELARETGTWTMTDSVDGHGDEQITWRLHLARGARPAIRSDRINCVDIPGHDDEPAIRLQFLFPGKLSLKVDESVMSDRYGDRYLRPLLIVAGSLTLPCRITCTFEPSFEMGTTR